MDFKPAIQKDKHQKALILGPCSAESQQQLTRIIEDSASLNPDFIRAGVWKPRTRPGHFQGIGEGALRWFKELKKQYPVKFCTEVANAYHVEACLEAGVDALWIGARTTVNPFYVQEIADALKGVDIPVLIKNPINPDLFLWLGAIERIHRSGIGRIAAIHRGFSFFGNSVYRNVPRWQIPIELKRRLPDLQLIADISHISGSPERLLEIAQIAMDLNYNGLMVETHPDPQSALSDSDQQITLDFLTKNILAKLIQRNPISNDQIYNQKIESIRKEIDLIDQEIIQLLGKRMQLAENIGSEKKENNISILQPERWNEIIQRLKEIAQQEQLSEEFVFSLIEAIHIESIQHQSRKMNS
ncbi:MAG: bifunctional 3-deoxy-7-phosphoheptulonate synthase/chorismate mutase type II [Saprospiraceae bacterium]|nr:bifunctional 3-deoxy-7-phosphoheptulonate synthase/chorismate mutase type II [Saprospiraceae bacterium]